MREQLARWAGTKAGKAIAKRAGDTKVGEPNEAEKFAVATTAGKGVKQAFISVGVLVAVIGLVRGFAPDLLWPPEQDAEIAAKLNEALATLTAAVGAVAFIVGTVKNMFKNRSLAKNGISMTKTLIVLLALALCAGCAITTPKGVYSLALTGDQVGFAKDVVAQVGNLYLEIEAQEAALEEAQAAGKTDRVAALLEKIANLKQKAAEKTEVVQADIAKATEVLELTP